MCGMSWIDQVQDRDGWKALVNVVMNLWVTYNARSFLTSWGTVSFSRRILLHAVSFQTKDRHFTWRQYEQTKPCNGYE